MHILHVITKGDVGGAQTHVLELATAQVEAGHQVTVVAGTDGPAMDRCRQRGVSVVVLPALGEARGRLWQRAALADLGATLTGLHPDIVHAHSSNGGFLARIACRRLGLVCVYTAHGWPFQRGAPLSQRLLSLAGEFVGGRLGDGVICLTEAEAERGRRARVVRPDRMWVIPNGLADVPPELRRRHGEGPPAIVMVARFAPPKRQGELIDAMATLTHLDWTLTFVGDGPELEACAVQAKTLLGDRVAFLGHCDDVPAVLAAHDVSVLWSAYEGMPISLLEGMRAGMACVASDLPGVRALFSSPPSGLTAKTQADLAVVLGELVHKPERRAEFGVRARARFEAAFSATAMEQAVAKVYEALLHR